MAVRKPLVIVAGQIQQLQSGDTLDAASPEVVLLKNVSGGTVTVGQPVIALPGDECDLAKADDLATSSVIGLVFDASIVDDATGGVLTDGVLTASTDAWDVVTGDTGGLTPGARYYVSAATAGLLADAAPTSDGEVVACIGKAISATKMRIGVENTVLL